MKSKLKLYNFLYKCLFCFVLCVELFLTILFSINYASPKNMLYLSFVLIVFLVIIFLLIYIYQIAYVDINNFKSYRPDYPYVILKKDVFNFYTTITIINNSKYHITTVLNDISILKILKIYNIKLLKNLTTDEVFYIIYQHDPIKYKYLIELTDEPNYITKKHRLIKLKKIK